MGWSPNTFSDPWTETQTPSITLTPASAHPTGCEKGNRGKKRVRGEYIHKVVMRQETIYF